MWKDTQQLLTLIFQGSEMGKTINSSVAYFQIVQFAKINTLFLK